MLRAAPGAAFEAYTSGFASGLVGTLGVRIRDGQGANTLARTTASIAEDIAGSGIYRHTFTAPTAAGEYWLIWDDGAGLYSDPELLLVTSSSLTPALPSARDLCALADVVAIVPGYQIGDDTAIDDTLALLITQESFDFMEETDREITARDSDPTRLFDIDQADVDDQELLVGDVATITAIEIQDQNGTVVQTLGAGAWVERPRSREAWEPITSITFPQGVTTPAVLRAGQLVELTGTWGFPDIPNTVRRAVARMVVARYLNDVASEGTAIAEAANRNEFNIGAALRVALDTRERFRIPTLG